VNSLPGHPAEGEFFPPKPKPSDPSSKKSAGIYHSTCSLLTFSRTAPYEKRIIELLRNNKDKRARKLAKKRVSNPILRDLGLLTWLVGNAFESEEEG